MRPTERLSELIEGSSSSQVTLAETFRMQSTGRPFDWPEDEREPTFILE
jgi:hypothetical protein